MSFPPRILAGLLCAVLGLGALDLWSWFYMADQRAAASRSISDAVACQDMARQITELRRQPAGASERVLGNSEVTGRVETAARSAGLGTDSLVRIAPDASKRVGDSPYVERPTQILLRRVSMPQLGVFLHQLTAGTQGLEIRGVRLTVPRDQEGAGLWTAEVTLTATEYSPKSSSERVP